MFIVVLIWVFFNSMKICMRSLIYYCLIILALGIYFQSWQQSVILFFLYVIFIAYSNKDYMADI